MLAQRVRHRDAVPILGDDGAPVTHTPEFLTQSYDEALAQLLAERSRLRDLGDEASFRAARERSETMIREGWFDPI
jgi:hypothetical protein